MVDGDQSELVVPSPLHENVGVVPVRVHHIHVQKGDLLDLPFTSPLFPTSAMAYLEGDQSLHKSASSTKYWIEPILNRSDGQRWRKNGWRTCA